VTNIRYLGNKTRLAKELAPILTKHLNGQNYYIEPFAGAFGMISNIDYPKRIAYDKDLFIISLMKAVRDGWNPPEELSEEEYKSLKNSSFAGVYGGDEITRLVAFAGYGCSFGGKWFAGFARGGMSGGKERNHVAESSRNLVKMRPKLQGITIGVSDYRNAVQFNGSSVYCLPEGQLIYQNGTYKPIEDVVENMTNLGNGNICTKKHIRKTENEELVTLTVKGISKHFPLQTSKDHVYLVYVENETELQEKRADELKVGDRLIINFDTSLSEVTPLNIVNTKDKRSKNLLHNHNEEYLAELLGFYVAEGHIQNGLVFSFSHLEIEYLERVKYLSNSLFGINAQIHPNRLHATVSQVRMHSKDLAKCFSNLVVGLAKTKRLSNEVMEWHPELQLKILQAWLKGDGCSNPQLERNRNKLVGTTTSEVLAYQMYNIALRCGLRPAIKQRTSNAPHSKAGVCVCYDIYFSINYDVAKILEVEPIGKERTSRKTHNWFNTTVITNIEKEVFNGNMYDLTTEHGQFWMFGNIAVHNCDPPYSTGTQYKSKFNMVAFWDWVRETSEKNYVYVSEYSAPSDFVSIWHKEHKSGIDHAAKTHKPTVEKLFVWNNSKSLTYGKV
jgi:intein/homing endonuclease